MWYIGMSMLARFNIGGSPLPNDLASHLKVLIVILLQANRLLVEFITFYIVN